jgi:peroxiredoxin
MAAAPEAGPRESMQIPAAASSAGAIRPLAVGQSMPDVTVKDMQGRPVELRRQVARRPAVIIFYRGGWCPYCNTHLGELATVEDRLVEMGYQLLALSADRPGEVARTQEEYGYEYKLLSDQEMRAARAFGVAFRVDDATIEKYHGYGIDLEEASGRGHHLLPVPSVFIVDTGATVRYVYANPDYKVRLDPERILQAARDARD